MMMIRAEVLFFIMGRRDNKYAPCLEVVLPRALNVNTAMTFSLSTVRDLYLGAASQPSRARQEERTAWYNKRLMRERGITNVKFLGIPRPFIPLFGEGMLVSPFPFY